MIFHPVSRRSLLKAFMAAGLPMMPVARAVAIKAFKRDPDQKPVWERFDLLAVLLGAAVARQLAPRLAAPDEPDGRVPAVLRLLLKRSRGRGLPEDLRRPPEFPPE